VSEGMYCFGVRLTRAIFVLSKNRLGVISPLSLFRYHDFSLVLCCSIFDKKSRKMLHKLANSHQQSEKLSSSSAFIVNAYTECIKLD